MNLTLFKPESFITSIHCPIEKNQMIFFDELDLRKTITHFHTVNCLYFPASHNGNG